MASGRQVTAVLSISFIRYVPCLVTLKLLGLGFFVSVLEGFWSTLPSRFETSQPWVFCSKVVPGPPRHGPVPGSFLRWRFPLFAIPIGLNRTRFPCVRMHLPISWKALDRSSCFCVLFSLPASLGALGRSRISQLRFQRGPGFPGLAFHLMSGGPVPSLFLRYPGTVLAVGSTSSFLLIALGVGRSIRALDMISWTFCFSCARRLSAITFYVSPLETEVQTISRQLYAILVV